LFGKTKQAYYKKISFSEKIIIEQAIVLEMVNKIRKRAQTKKWGGRKLYKLVKEELAGFPIKMGRDKFFALLRSENLLVSPRKRKYFTTLSHHWLRKYDNLIENLVIRKPNQLWVSDITYVKFNDEVYYLFLITDAYSQKIVGFNLSVDLKAASAVEALKMAIRDNKTSAGFDLVHHSDRGVQYCSGEYVDILTGHSIGISMTNPASPQENAIAERVNGILKEEWLYDLILSQGQKPYKKVKAIIKIYNELRPHNSIGNLTPEQIHDKGFLRDKAERVIGKTYSWNKKADPKMSQPVKSENAIGANNYSLSSCSSAELDSASLWYCNLNI
jgi:transposase InsO family protein